MNGVVSGSDATREYDRIRRQCAPPPFGVGPGLLKPLKKPAVLPPVAGYSLWLDGSYSGNSNATWVDQSGNGYNAQQTGGSASQLTANAVNGMSAYGFGGVTYGAGYYKTGAYPTSSYVSLFVMLVVNPLASANGGVVAVSYAYYAVDVGNPAGYGGVQVYAGNEQVIGSGSLPATGTPQLFTLIASSPNSYVVTYGPQTLPSYYLVPTVSSLPRYVGRDPIYTGEGFYGYLCEILEYPFTVTSPQAAAISSYLTTKWG